MLNKHVKTIVPNKMYSPCIKEAMILLLNSISPVSISSTTNTAKDL